MKKIAIFISGAGSNAERMVLGFAGHEEIKVSCLISTKENLRILSLCEKHSVSYLEYVWQDQNKEQMTHLLLERGIEWIVLAGFLKKIPEVMIKAFPNRIINLHPSLLPQYGGKGMYGMHVHNAVKAHNETETGITIHYVNEHYDEGAIIFQAKTALNSEDTPDTIAQKIHTLEQKHFPKVIASLIAN